MSVCVFLGCTSRARFREASQRLGRTPAWLSSLAVALALAMPSAPSVQAGDANDYPTAVRADYVFACMQVNGQTRDALNRCSCSIDRIAELLSYDDYEQAETIMSVVQKGGEKVTVFRSYGPLKEKVKQLRKAQVEAELICF